MKKHLQIDSAKLAVNRKLQQYLFVTQIRIKVGLIHLADWLSILPM